MNLISLSKLSNCFNKFTICLIVGSEVFGVLSRRKDDDLALKFVSKIKSKTSPTEKRRLPGIRHIMICVPKT